MIITLIFLSDDNQEKFNPEFTQPDHYEKKFNLIRCKTDQEVLDSLNDNDNISMIITAERSDGICHSKYHKLYNDLPNYWKIRWMNIPKTLEATYDVQAHQVMTFFASSTASEQEYFSIITPVYHTRRDVFERTYNSLKNQSCKDWEWILVDDSKDESLTKHIRDVAAKDFRLKYFRLTPSGNIGNVKYNGFRLGRGKWLIELDHDDVLMPNALDRIRKAFKKFPDAGFLYSDCAEVEINKYNEIVGYRNYARDKNNNPTVDPWGYSRTGKAMPFTYESVNVLANVSPQVNSQSIRHITAAPNHVRVWKKSVYEQIGGHSEKIHVADDYQMMVRTFLITKMIHLNSAEYVQFYEVDGNQNTQYSRNKDIQRITEYVSRQYDKQIHDRILELGADDYSWKKEHGSSVYWIDYGSIDDKNNVNYKVSPEDL